MSVRIGLISDTHNLLRPAALEFLRGCAHIVHAGDICGEAVLHELRRLAPLTAVRGNNDKGTWAQTLREVDTLDVEGVRLLVVHHLKALREVPEGVRVVVSGHSHRPQVQERAGVLHVNPGSAGPRRFKLPVSVGELLVEGARVVARCVTLNP